MRIHETYIPDACFQDSHIYVSMMHVCDPWSLTLMHVCMMLLHMMQVRMMQVRLMQVHMTHVHMMHVCMMHRRMMLVHTMGVRMIHLCMMHVRRMQVHMRHASMMHVCLMHVKNGDGRTNGRTDSWILGVGFLPCPKFLDWFLVFFKYSSSQWTLSSNITTDVIFNPCWVQILKWDQWTFRLKQKQCLICLSLCHGRYQPCNCLTHLDDQEDVHIKELELWDFESLLLARCCRHLFKGGEADLGGLQVRNPCHWLRDGGSWR